MPLRLSEYGLSLLKAGEQGIPMVKGGADSLEPRKEGLFSTIGRGVQSLSQSEAPFQFDDSSNAQAALHIPRMIGNIPTDFIRETATLAQGVKTLGGAALFGPGEELQRRFLGTDDTDNARLLRGLAGAVLKGPGEEAQRHLFGTEDTQNAQMLRGIGKGFAETLWPPENVVEHPVAAASSLLAALTGGAGVVGKAGVKQASNLARAAARVDPLTSAAEGMIRAPSAVRLGTAKAREMGFHAGEKIQPIISGTGTGRGASAIEQGLRAGREADIPVTRFAPVTTPENLGQTMEELFLDFLMEREFISNEPGLRGDHEIPIAGGDLLQAEFKQANAANLKPAGKLFEDLTKDKSLNEIRVNIADLKDEVAKVFEAESVSIEPNLARVDDSMLELGQAVPNVRPYLRNEQGQIVGRGPEPGIYEGEPLETIVQTISPSGIPGGVDDAVLSFIKKKGEIIFNAPDEITVRELFNIRQHISKDVDRPVGAIFNDVEKIINEKIASETFLIGIADKEYADAQELIDIVNDAFNAQARKPRKRKGPQRGITEANLEGREVEESAFQLMEEITGYPAQVAGAASLLSGLLPTNLVGRAAILAEAGIVGASIGSGLVDPLAIPVAIATMYLQLPIFSPRKAGMLALKLGKGKQVALEAVQAAQQARTIAQQFNLPQTATIGQVYTRLLERQQQQQSPGLLQRLGGR